MKKKKEFASFTFYFPKKLKYKNLRIIFQLNQNLLLVFIHKAHYPSQCRSLGKHLQFVCLCVSSIKTVTRRIMRLNELSIVVRRSRRISKDSSSSV